MPNVGHFHHIVMEVSDLDRSAKFCEETIRLELVGRVPEAALALPLSDARRDL
jgi:hypothetical protein